MNYIYNQQSHDDYSVEYMNSLGIDADTQQAILNDREFQLTQRQERAKVTRDNFIESSIQLTGTEAVYQMDTKSRNLLQVALNEAESQGLADTETRNWRLSDNTWRETSLAEIKQLFSQYAARIESVWAQFGAWDAGDKSTDFVIE